ncbi:beta-lactamase/transpeptidase-like protein [Gymnopilus junonius]|uniref:Beta-lactamase/transpeptidase-like protein n=1 Tax=Gymnopilus junonius TaxID=109634 RepID=A0A9P5N863_GYMJU|nr:beta-lactamase/transpeptidase-like protein [Gymnopilus junonius]
MATLTSKGKQALDDLVSQVIQDNRIPGFIYGATSVDEEIYFKAGGTNVVNDPESGQVNGDSIFWICSQSKMIVHLAALKLIEEGKLAFEDPISHYFPEFAHLVIVEDQMAPNWTYKPAEMVITVKHLLHHTSGLFYPMRDIKFDQQMDIYAAPHSAGDAVSEFISLVKGDLPGIPVLFEPGKNFVYGFSSDILGFAIEKATGQSLESYLQENMFKPLGMSASFYLTPDLKTRLVDLTYRRNGNMEAWAGQSKLIEQGPAKVKRHMGGVGLYASLRDYLTLLRHILQIHKGTAKNTLFSAEIIRSVFEPVLNDEGSKGISDLLEFYPFTPRGSVLQWSSALAIAATDWPGRRRKGTAFWFGWANTYHTLDTETGIATVFGTQIIPTADQKVYKLYVNFEETLYAGLSQQKPQ